jgi:FkbM family methyltransferase
MSEISVLLGDQLTKIPDARVVFDVGAHHGYTALKYLDVYPNATVFSFEPQTDNLRIAEKNLFAYRDRSVLVGAAVAERAGTQELFVNSHDGTHSLLPIGEQRYWAGPAHNVSRESVLTLTLDSFAEANGIRCIDILKMDIQGGELRALEGAAKLLQERRIRLVVAEVEFQYLYRDQPLAWEVGAYLQRFGFGLYRLHDCYYHEKNPNVLSWADAVFLGPEFLGVSSWE